MVGSEITPSMSSSRNRPRAAISRTAIAAKSQPGAAGKSLPVAGRSRPTLDVVAVGGRRSLRFSDFADRDRSIMQSRLFRNP